MRWYQVDEAKWTIADDVDGLVLQEGLDDTGVDRRVVPVEKPGIPEIRPLPCLGCEELLEGFDDKFLVNCGAQR